MTTSRRTFLAATVAGAALAGAPRLLRAQPPAIKVAALHPVTGPLAEHGQACRLGALMAAQEVNAAGGIQSMGGARLELVPGDTASDPEVARAEAERVIDAGAQVLTGAYHSAHTAAIIPVAQQRRVPLLIDISPADALTANVARSVRDGLQRVQYVYRSSPTTAMVGARAVQFMAEIFHEARVSPTRVVLMYSDDAFGRPQADSFRAAQRAMSPGFDVVEVIPWPENATDLSAEVARAKLAKAEIIAPITRAASATLLLQELARQRVDVLGVVSPGAPGLHEPEQIAQLGPLIEYVMDNVPWPNFRDVHTQAVAAEYAKHSGGRSFDTNAGYAYEAIRIVADGLERAGSTDPDAIAEALRTTRLAGGLMVSTGPVVFNETGDNPNASTAMIQVLRQKPAVVWPEDAAVERFVFPRPRP